MIFFFLLFSSENNKIQAKNLKYIHDIDEFDRLFQRGDSRRRIIIENLVGTLFCYLEFINFILRSSKRLTENS